MACKDKMGKARVALSGSAGTQGGGLPAAWVGGIQLVALRVPCVSRLCL